MEIYIFSLNTYGVTREVFDEFVEYVKGLRDRRISLAPYNFSLHYISGEPILLECSALRSESEFYRQEVHQQLSSLGEGCTMIVSNVFFEQAMLGSNIPDTSSRHPMPPLIGRDYDILEIWLPSVYTQTESVMRDPVSSPQNSAVLMTANGRQAESEAIDEDASNSLSPEEVAAIVSEAAEERFDSLLDSMLRPPAG